MHIKGKKNVLFLKKVFIEVLLIYNIVLVSGIQQSDSDIFIDNFSYALVTLNLFSMSVSLFLFYK